MQNIPDSTAQNSAYPFTPPFGGGQLKIETTSKAITPFAGLLSFLGWLGKIGLSERFATLMPFSYNSPRAIPPAHILLAFLVTVIVGGSRFAHGEWLRFDTALHRMMGVSHFPARDAILRFFHRFTQAGVEAFWRPLWLWLLAMWTPPEGVGFSLDLDSTIFQRSGQQEGAAKGYNPQRKGRLSHHPLIAVLAEAPFVLHAWLRSGNTASARGVVPFLQEALSQLPKTWRLRMVRADSGFFENGLLSHLETMGLPYIVVAKMTRQVKSSLRSVGEWQRIDATHCAGEFTLRLQGWSKARRFVVVRERVSEESEGGGAKAKKAVGRKLLDVPGYTYRVWCANSLEAPEVVWRDYNQRATIEQRIEELKNDLHADGFCTQNFFATEAAFLAVLFAFNLLATYQAQTTPEAGYRQPATLRAEEFLGGAMLGRSGQNEVIRISESWGGAERHKPLLDRALTSQEPIASLLTRAKVRQHQIQSDWPWQLPWLYPGGGEI